MKSGVVLISVLLLTGCRIGLSQVYLDSSYNEVARDKALYYQTLEPAKDIHFIQKTYLMNDTLVRLEPMIIRKGEQIADGRLMIFYNSGKLHYSRDYKNDVLNGEVKGYYENGIVRRLEHYRNGKRTDGKCYGVTGKDTLYYVYETQATFKGKDILGFREYVQRKVVYPPESVEARNYGKVTVHFRVSAEGKIEDVRILDAPDKYLAREVLKTVSNAGQWKPATLEGKNVSKDFVIPVIFVLQ
jgi:TonB family protein